MILTTTVTVLQKTKVIVTIMMRLSIQVPKRFVTMVLIKIVMEVTYPAMTLIMTLIVLQRMKVTVMIQMLQLIQMQ